MRKKLFCMLLSAALISGVPGTVYAAEASGMDGEDVYTIGVAVYDPDAAEMEMFMDYYRDYIQQGFSVKFIFSDVISDAEDEMEFIHMLKDAGGQGLISFAGIENLPGIVECCEENELYYVLGSNNVSDEDYEEIKDNPWYLGSVGPELTAVYEAGRDMAGFFLEKDAGSIVIMSGGASVGNALHASRTEGMLDVLEEDAGLILDGDSAEAAETDEILELQNEKGDLRVVICPGYTEGGDGLQNLDTVLESGDFDTLMSAFHVASYLDRILEKEEEQGSNMMVGAIDSFTENNFEIFNEKDSFGNSPIDYVQGKYASMAGPAFAMMYNAVTGNRDVISEDGSAVRFYQEFWKAESKQEYVEMYGYATGIYENAYSCDDLMKVIKVFNDSASPEKLKELAEANSLEEAKERIFD